MCGMGEPDEAIQRLKESIRASWLHPGTKESQQLGVRAGSAPPGPRRRGLGDAGRVTYAHRRRVSTSFLLAVEVLGHGLGNDVGGRTAGALGMQT